MSGTMRGAVLVLGATGEIGGGVVRAALARGHAVLAVGRDPARLQALRERHPGAALDCLAGSVAGDADGAALAARLRALERPLAGVVASLGGPAGRGRLLDRPATFLRRHIDRQLLPHLAAARHLLPVLAERGRGGSYVLVGGPGSDYPWAGYGHCSIAAAALRMLAQVLHDEARALQLRVQLLALDTPVRTDANQAHACPGWPSALAVGQRALALLERCDGGRAHPVVHYPPRPSRHVDAGASPSAAARVRRETHALLESIASSTSTAGCAPAAQKGILPP